MTDLDTFTALVTVAGLDFVKDGDGHKDVVLGRDGYWFVIFIDTRLDWIAPREIRLAALKMRSRR